MRLGTKIQLRRAAANALIERGFEVEERSGQGIPSGGRLIARPAKGPALEVAVRIIPSRSLGFSRAGDGAFRTLKSVQLILAVVRDHEGAGDFAVLAFEAKTLVRCYSKALEQLENAGRSPDLDVPIFIPVDEKSKKNVGHNIAGLKKLALWSSRIDTKQLEDQRLDKDTETFIERVKREFAERNEVDASKVIVEFRIVS